MTTVKYRREELIIGDKKVSFPEGAKVEIPQRKYDKYNFQIGYASWLALEQGWEWGNFTSDSEGFAFFDKDATNKRKIIGIIPYAKIMGTLPELASYLEVTPFYEPVWKAIISVNRLLLPGVVATENFFKAKIVVPAAASPNQEKLEALVSIPPATRSPVLPVQSVTLNSPSLVVGFTNDYVLESC